MDVTSRRGRIASATALLAVLAVTGCAGATPVGAPTPPPVPSSTEVAVIPIPDTTNWPEELAAAYAETTRLALDEAAFWDVIAGFEGQASFERAEVVSASLSTLTGPELIAFDARLTLALFHLDGADFMTWYGQNDPLSVQFGGYVSEDVFLYARGAVVAAGPEAYATAIETRTFPVFDEDGSGEAVLSLTWSAAELAGLDPEAWFAERFALIPLSYETGSNSPAWPGR